MGTEKLQNLPKVTQPRQFFPRKKVLTERKHAELNQSNWFSKLGCTEQEKKVGPLFLRVIESQKYGAQEIIWSRMIL